MATNINWFVLWVPSSKREADEKKKPTEIVQSGAGVGGGGSESGKIAVHHTKFEVGWNYLKWLTITISQNRMIFYSETTKE